MSYPKYKNVAIVGLARDEAPLAASSADIEKRLEAAMRRLKLPAGLLASLSGIVNRRLYPPDLPPSQAAATTWRWRKLRNCCNTATPRNVIAPG